jgi:hypothetical protein
MGWLRALAGCFCLAGCAVAEYPYPVAWDPLIPQPDSDCSEFQGRYADRGERDDDPNKPSLAREMFGEFSDWEKRRGGAGDAEGPACSWSRCRRRRAALFPHAGGKRRRLPRRAPHRARQALDRRLHHVRTPARRGRAEPRRTDVVAQVEEMAYGVMFVIFPVVGTARHWYRFQRLP